MSVSLDVGKLDTETDLSLVYLLQRARFNKCLSHDKVTTALTQ